MALPVQELCITLAAKPGPTAEPEDVVLVSRGPRAQMPGLARFRQHP